MAVDECINCSDRQHPIYYLIFILAINPWWGGGKSCNSYLIIWLAVLVNLLPARGHLTILAVAPSVVGQLLIQDDLQNIDTIIAALLGSWSRTGPDRTARTCRSGYQEDPGSDEDGGPQVMRLCKARPALRGSCTRGQVCWLHLQGWSVLLSNEEQVCSKSHQHQDHPSEPGQGCIQHFAQQGPNQNTSKSKYPGSVQTDKRKFAKE